METRKQELINLIIENVQDCYGFEFDINDHTEEEAQQFDSVAMSLAENYSEMEASEFFTQNELNITIDLLVDLSSLYSKPLYEARMRDAGDPRFTEAKPAEQPEEITKSKMIRLNIEESAQSFFLNGLYVAEILKTNQRLFSDARGFYYVAEYYDVTIINPHRCAAGKSNQDLFYQRFDVASYTSANTARRAAEKWLCEKIQETEFCLWMDEMDRPWKQEETIEEEQPQDNDLVSSEADELHNLRASWGFVSRDCDSIEKEVYIHTSF